MLTHSNFYITRQGQPSGKPTHGEGVFEEGERFFGLENVSLFTFFYSGFVN